MDKPPLAEIMPGIQIAAGACAALGVITCLVAVVTVFGRRSLIVGLALATWLAYGIYEYLIPQGLRYDLLFFVPLMVVVTGIGLGSFFMPRAPS